VKSNVRIIKEEVRLVAVGGGGFVRVGIFFGCFRASTNDYDDGTRIQRMKRIFTDLRGIVKTPEHVALIAEPERGPQSALSA